MGASGEDLGLGDRGGMPGAGPVLQLEGKREDQVSLKVGCRLGSENRPVFVSDGFHLLNETCQRSSAESERKGRGRCEEKV